MKCLIAAFGLVVAAALPATAQQLTLDIADGRVTLDATNVPARQILAEWARIGGTKVVGAEKITGAPLTLKLVDTPERQALDIILRNVAGFIAAPRRTATSGASVYDRILVMATSTSVTQAASANTRPGAPGLSNANAMDGTQRRVMAPPRPPGLPPSPADDSDRDDRADDTADTGTPQPVFTFPVPGQGGPAGANQPVFVPMQNGQFGTTQSGVPTITLQPGPNGPTIYNFVPNAPTTPAPATTPFGVVGAPTPGMIQLPPPTPGQPTLTPAPPRPPGR